MKKIVVLFLIIFPTVLLIAQEKQIIRVGLGLPIFTGNENDFHDKHSITSIPVFFIEKPIKIKIKGFEKLSLNPGITYFYFWDNNTSGGLGSTYSHRLNHQSLNGYTKLFYQSFVKKKEKPKIFLGCIAGVHLFTQTEGTITSRSVMPQFGNSEVNIKESGKDFFNTIYYGFIGRFLPHTKTKHKLQPSLELSFFPNFISKRNSSNTSAFQISVLLDINP